MQKNRKRLKILSDRIKTRTYFNKSYSQEGEDIVLSRFLNPNKPGYYIDIGAHHPHRFSNTYFFYKRGWTGINIDADPSLIELFNKERKMDKNLAYGVGNKPGFLSFYVFNEKALNTFDKKLANERGKKEEYTLESIKKIKVKKLKDILAKSLPKKQKIDFMSVDVEGRDLDVLRSNDWIKYRPSFVLVESYNTKDILKIQNDKVVQYLKQHNYIPVAKTYYTIIFRDNNE